MSGEFAQDVTKATITNCIEDIKAKVLLVPEFPDSKMFDVYSDTDLLDKAALVKTPYVAVMYEGSVPTAGDQSRQGMAALTQVAIVLGVASKSIGNVNSRNEAALYLDAIRNKIKTTRSPTQHKWQWAGEKFAGVVGNVNIYIQRWTTFTPLTG